MIAVVLDTNSIHKDPWLTNEPGGELLARAASGSCVLVIPKVVIDELRRQKREAVREQAENASRAVDELSDTGAEVNHVGTSVVETFELLEDGVDTSFDNLVARPGVLVAPTPVNITVSLVERDLARRRPFLEVGTQAWSTGFRDAVIWETLLDHVQGDPSLERVVFVTADKGFLTADSASLHQDLLDDLDMRGIVRDRVVSVKTTYNARSEVDRFVAARAAAAVPPDAAAPVSRLATLAAAEAANQAELVTVATDALFELVGKDISLQMVYGGDYDYPDFVQFTFPEMESGSIAAIDQSTEFEFVEDGEVVRASARAWISIEGATFKGDWFVDGGESVALVGELNDHYFETSTEIDVVAIVEIDVSGDSPEALDVVLKDAPTAHGSGESGDSDQANDGSD